MTPLEWALVAVGVVVVSVLLLTARDALSPRRHAQGTR